MKREDQFDAKREALRNTYKIKEDVQGIPKHTWDKMLVEAMRSKHEKVEAARGREDFVGMRVKDFENTLQVCSDACGVRITVYRGIAVIDHGVRISIVDLVAMAEESNLGQDGDLVNMVFPVMREPISRSIHGVVAELKAIQKRPITNGSVVEVKLNENVNKLIDKIILYVEDKLS